jgi:hypothetical protein
MFLSVCCIYSHARVGPLPAWRRKRSGECTEIHAAEGVAAGPGALAGSYGNLHSFTAQSTGSSHSLRHESVAVIRGFISSGRVVSRSPLVDHFLFHKQPLNQSSCLRASSGESSSGHPGAFPALTLCAVAASATISISQVVLLSPHQLRQVLRRFTNTQQDCFR